jgi:acyl carrier protein
VTPQQAREQIGSALKRAAPGSDVDAVDPDAELRDALDLDSLDFLRFVEILSETSGRRIDEDDYPELATLNSSIRFLAIRLPPGGQDGYLTGTGSACCAQRGKRVPLFARRVNEDRSQPSQGCSMPASVRPGFDGGRSRNATAAGVACFWIQVPKSSRR